MSFQTDYGIDDKKYNNINTDCLDRIEYKLQTTSFVVEEKNSQRGH